MTESHMPEPGSQQAEGAPVPSTGTNVPTAPGNPSGPRTWPIVWGAMVLAFCAYLVFQLVAPGVVTGTVFFIFAVIGLGVLLLGVGIAVVVRQTRRN